MKTFLLWLIFITISLTSCSQPEMKYNKLTPAEAHVILYKGTEMPNTGHFNKHFDSGTYVCKQCNAALYKSEDKFDSKCGWPAFDDEIPGAVSHIPDKDGIRTEIVCTNCGGHLGHVFEGEGFTEKNIRHCVNSISLDFIKNQEKDERYDTAIFASGCFWGTEYYMKKARGVISTEVGYTGGHTLNPTYKQVCDGNTGHAEAVRIVFDPTLTTYETLARLFFETHDPGQKNRQGPDIGHQYRSAVFYFTEEQHQIIKKLIKLLEAKSYKVVTEVEKADVFYPAEDYHQDYYSKTGGNPYCHTYTSRFQ